MNYKNPSLPIQERVEDLLSRMTLKEKVAQLVCSLTVGGADNLEMFKNNMADGIGTISYLNNSLTGNNTKDREFLKNLQRYLVENTRLGIPGLVHNEGIAGAQIPGATTFPQSLSVASTWEPGLAHKMGEVVKKQLMAYGIRAVHSPLFDLGRDPRWGRIGETYGEDPYLVAQMGVSYVQGVQGDHEVMAAAKHFVGYGNAEGGRNGGEQQIAERKLLDSYCFPFEAAIQDGGVSGIMNSYGILNEQAVSTSKWLLSDILRGKLGFDGLVVADYGSVNHAYVRYRVAEGKKETAILALTAGMDVEQPSNSCYQYLVEAVENGEIEESLVDRSVRRVLKMKFELGLFESPYESGNFEDEIRQPECEALTLEIAEKSIVMVKNEGTILPLRNKELKIALIGPTADNKVNLFGGYSSVGTANTTSGDFDRSEEDNFLKTAYASLITEFKDSLIMSGIIFEDQPSPEQKALIMARLRKNMSKTNAEYASAEEFVQTFYPQCKSVKEVLEEQWGQERVLYAPGCGIRTEIEGGFEEVRSAVEQADLVIAVLGGKESMRAADATCGENKDNHNIGLEQVQQRMMEEIFRLGKPVVTVLVDGRPLALPEISEHSQALLFAWLPAQAGAEAIVNVLTGKTNPGGKLPVTVLKHASQIPMYHSRLPFFVEVTDWAEFVDHDMNKPLYPFGHGLSYTQFEYSGLAVDSKVPVDGAVTIRFKISNTGSLKGDEVVQVYIRDTVSSIVRPVKQLVGFVRVSLDVNETKEVACEVNMRQLAFHDLNMEQVVEPGDMEVFIGASSQDIRLQGSFEIIGEKRKVERKVFSSRITVG